LDQPPALVGDAFSALGHATRPLMFRAGVPTS
jgi:hypothetical protein